ncbi:MAG TPA: rod shape-determining protein MreD [Streptosporangiaceae bacterium]|nr:rod shape-determining protein MreD [Streptosporangiaceae bacterium]
MRAAWLIVMSLAVALVVQLTLLNGLHLPGGGVPDLVLVLVAALAMAEGPVAGAVTGFAVGLCLDLAPPGSAAIGQYALVFCLAGWAAGRLSPVASHSTRYSAGLLATGLLALVAAAAEVVSAVVSLLVTPRAATLSQVRVVLPSTIGYDLLLCPLVLSLVMLAGTLLAERPAGDRFRGVLAAGSRGAAPAALAGTARSPRAARRARRRFELRLGQHAGVTGDGWLSTSRVPGRPTGHVPARRAPRLRPGSGVPGSASGLVFERHRPAAPVHLRLAGGRRGDGVIGTGGLAGGIGSSRGLPGRHPGLLAGGASQFRPHRGEPGGSSSVTRIPVTRTHPPRRPAVSFTGRRGDGSVGHTLSRGPTRPALTAPRRPATIRFGPHRGGGSVGHTLSRGPARPALTAPRRSATIRFGPHRGDGSVGQTLYHGPTRSATARPRLTPRRRPAVIRFGGQRGGAAAGPRLRMGARRSGITAAATVVPSLTFTSRPSPVSRHSAAVPRFGRKTALLRPARPTSGLVPGGVLTEATFHPRPRRTTPRLRLSGGAPGMLGGTGRGPRLGSPPGRAGKQPRFSYGRRSPLSVLTSHRLGRRLGGRWLARWRVGSRSAVWLVGRRMGDPR